jgi:hypothetical protein
LLLSSSHVEDSSSVYGSGIGVGISQNSATSVIDAISISSLTVGAIASSAGYAIGSGVTGREVGSLSFSGSCFIACKDDEVIQHINASSILLLDGSFTFVTGEAPLFGKSATNLGSFDLAIAYRRVTSPGSERLPSLACPFLHVGNLSAPDSLLSSLEFCIQKARFFRCFDDSVGRIRSVVVGSPGEGNYSFPGWFDGHSANFQAVDGTMDFAVGLNGTFISFLLLVFPSSPAPFDCTAGTDRTLSVDGTLSFSLSNLPLSDASDLTTPGRSGCSPTSYARHSMRKWTSDDLVESVGIASRSNGNSGFLQSEVVSPMSIDVSDGPAQTIEAQLLVWIAVGVGVALIAVIASAVIAVCLRRRTLGSETDKTRSESESPPPPTDTRNSVIRESLLLSQDNPLTEDGSLVADDFSRMGILLADPFS